MSVCDLVSQVNCAKEQQIEGKEKHGSRTMNNNPKKSGTSLLYSYSKEDILELRSAPLALQKPSCLSEEFINKDGVWDPEAWHRSNSSRSASPAVDMKTPAEVKKIDEGDDGIALAPHRRSFRLGCSVQPVGADGDRQEKLVRQHPISLSECKARLTGRAAGQRRTLETSYRENPDSIGEKPDSSRGGKIERLADRDGRGHFVDHTEHLVDKERGERSIESRKPERLNNDDRVNRGDKVRDREKTHAAKDGRFENSKIDQAAERQENVKREMIERNDRSNRRDQSRKDKGKEQGGRDKLPEWMTEGPTSQTDTMELKGFERFEEEKKAFAKKAKRVRISPSVEKEPANNKKPAAALPAPSLGEEKQDLANTKVAKDAALAGDVIKRSEEKAFDDKSASGKSTPSSKPGFDINDFFSGVSCLPSQLFHEEVLTKEGFKSRFSQWFQTQASRSSSRSSSNISPHDNRPGSVGMQEASPNSPFFTPIQPAPFQPSNAAVFSASIPSAVPMLSSKVVLHKQHHIESGEQPLKSAREIKGRLTISDIEPGVVAASGSGDAHHPPGASETEKSAFDMLVRSMKEAGQLPEKPAPVVTGLPDHLFPKPPKRSSPSFEKLKRHLSRSPSPVQTMRAVSAVASIIASNPHLDLEIAALQKQQQLQYVPLTDEQASQQHLLHRQLYEGLRHGQTLDQSATDGLACGLGMPRLDMSDKLLGATSPFGDHYTGSKWPISGLSTDVVDVFSEDPRPSMYAALAKSPAPISASFMPTSVLKKIHTEKQRERGSPTPPPAHPDVSQVSMESRSSSFPDLLAETIRAAQVPLPRGDTSLSATFKDMTLSPDNLLLENTRMIDRHADIFTQSLPGTPRYESESTALGALHSTSEPVTPERRDGSGPPLVHRITERGPNHLHSHLTPNGVGVGISSAFSASVAGDSATSAAPVVGVIGSGRTTEQKLQSRGREERSAAMGPDRGTADPRLAPGYPSRMPASEKPLSHQHMMLQQQMLEAKKMAHLQHQQQESAMEQKQLQQRLQIQEYQHRMVLQRQQQDQRHKEHPATKSVPTPIGVKPLLPNPQQSQSQPNLSRSPNDSALTHHRSPLVDFQKAQSVESRRPQLVESMRPPVSEAVRPPTIGEFIRPPGVEPRAGQAFASSQPNLPASLASLQPSISGSFRGSAPGVPLPVRSTPAIPMPMQQPGLQQALNSMNRMPIMQNVNMAAQALMQQQFAAQAVRARMLAQAQLLQQRPNQALQAAFMAQMLARGQLQAQAAMMLNPRAMASNLQIMAEQMGLRPPSSVGVAPGGRPLPMPMIPPQPSAGQDATGEVDAEAANANPSDSPLAKWFGEDVLKQMPAMPSGRVLSLEELEGKF